MLALADIVPLRLAEVTYPPGHPLAGAGGVVLAFAIRHPRGALLVDTGIGEGEPEVDRAYRPRRRPLADALGEHGLRISDIVAVVNTHLHFDHCGQNAAFAGRPIHVQRSERAAAREPGHTVREWVDVAGAAYALLDGDAQIADGVSALATPGHTPGHQSLVIETAEGVVVLAGQAIFSAAEFAGRASPQASDDRSVASAERLRAIRPRRVHFSHDEAVWEPPAVEA
ncbi:MAG: N-acyl homoserine lactonase family protein [Candidatus Limnocylindria bacterium]